MTLEKARLRFGDFFREKNELLCELVKEKCKFATLLEEHDQMKISMMETLKDSLPTHAANDFELILDDLMKKEAELQRNADMMSRVQQQIHLLYEVIFQRSR